MYVNTLPEAYLVVHSLHLKSQASRTVLDTKTEAEGDKETTVNTVETVVPDVKELKTAQKLRSTCAQLVKKHCASLSFGLMVRPDKLGAVEVGASEAKELAMKFTTSAKTCALYSDLLIFKIEKDDVAASRAVAADLVILFDQFQKSLETVDAKTLRNLVKRLKGVPDLLPEETRLLLTEAIKSVKTDAKRIERALKSGEDYNPQNGIEVLETIKDRFQRLLSPEEVSNAVPIDSGTEQDTGQGEGESAG